MIVGVLLGMAIGFLAAAMLCASKDARTFDELDSAAASRWIDACNDAGTGFRVDELLRAAFYGFDE